MANCLKYLVVMDPDAPHQTALDRAVALAGRSGANVVAFACCYLSEQDMLHFSSRHEAKHDARQRLEQWLYCQTGNLHGRVKITCESAWNGDHIEAACHRAQHHDACMMFLCHHDRQPLQHWLEHSPCPLYLATDRDTLAGRHPVLAAIDPRSDDDAHTALNYSVLATASSLAEDMDAVLNLVCALDEREAIASHLGFEYLDNITAEQQDIAQRFAIDPGRVHLQIGRPNTVISAWARQLQAAVLVVGNRHEQRLTSTLLGCQAEQLQDGFNGDLLVIN